MSITAAQKFYEHIIEEGKKASLRPHLSTSTNQHLDMPIYASGHATANAGTPQVPQERFQQPDIRLKFTFPEKKEAKKRTPLHKLSEILKNKPLSPLEREAYMDVIDLELSAVEYYLSVFYPEVEKGNHIIEENITAWHIILDSRDAKKADKEKSTKYSSAYDKASLLLKDYKDSFKDNGRKYSNQYLGRIAAAFQFRSDLEQLESMQEKHGLSRIAFLYSTSRTQPQDPETVDENPNLSNAVIFHLPTKAIAKTS